MLEVPGSGFKYSFLENREKESLTRFPSEKLDDEILKKYLRQYFDDILVEFGKQPSIHLILIFFTIFFNIL
jgi:hypothetical protein